MTEIAIGRWRDGTFTIDDNPVEWRSDVIRQALLGRKFIMYDNAGGPRQSFGAPLSGKDLVDSFVSKIRRTEESDE